MGSFSRKIIRATITLVKQDSTNAQASSSFKDDANSVVLQGFRTSCNIGFGNGAVMPSAKIKIWGVSANVMDKLTNVNWNTHGRQNNLVTIEAGTDPDNLDVVFSGNITFAYPDYSSAPDVCLVMDCAMGYFEKVQAIPPETHKGETSVAGLFEAWAKLLNKSFENNGVDKKVTDYYSAESLQDRMIRLAKDADIQLYNDVDVVAIAPKGYPRKTQVPVITPESGLIGYPVPTNTGITFRCLYDKYLRFGAQITIKDSLVKQCNGDWRVCGLTINIESELPQGQWFCDVNATELGNAAVIPK